MYQPLDHLYFDIYIYWYEKDFWSVAVSNHSGDFEPRKKKQTLDAS